MFLVELLWFLLFKQIIHHNLLLQLKSNQILIFTLLSYNHILLQFIHFIYYNFFEEFIKVIEYEYAVRYLEIIDKKHSIYIYQVCIYIQQKKKKTFENNREEFNLAQQLEQSQQKNTNNSNQSVGLNTVRNKHMKAGDLFNSQTNINNQDEKFYKSLLEDKKLVNINPDIAKKLYESIPQYKKKAKQFELHKVKADLAEQAAEAKRKDPILQQMSFLSEYRMGIPISHMSIQQNIQKDLNMSVEQWKYKFLYPFGNIAPIPSDQKSHPQNAKGIRDSLNSLISNTMNDGPYGNADGGIQNGLNVDTNNKAFNDLVSKKYLFPIDKIHKNEWMKELQNPIQITPEDIIRDIIEIEVIFKNNYPNFMGNNSTGDEDNNGLGSEQQQLAMRLINGAITEVLDPKLYYSRIILKYYILNQYLSRILKLIQPIVVLSFKSRDISDLFLYYNDSKSGPFVQNIAPSHSPQVNDLHNHYDNNSNNTNFINHQNEEEHIPMMYSQQPPSVFVNINHSNQVAAQSAVSATQNQVRNNAHSNAHDDLMDIIDFESEKSMDHQENAANNPFSQQQHNQQILSGSGEMNNHNLLDIYDDDENNGNINHYDNSQVDINNNNISQQNMSQNNQNDMSNAGNGGNALGDEEEESVYIKDNIVMRRIQIEGEEQEFLMDPDGNIYDMNGNFIGTANANDLEEVDDDGAADNGNDDDEGGHEEQLIL